MTRLRAGQSEVGIPVWARDCPLFPKRPDRLWGPHSPASNSIVTEILDPRAKRWGVQLITHLYPVPRLMNGTIQLLLYTPSGVQKENFTITITFSFHIIIIIIIIMLLEPGSSPVRPNDASALHSLRCLGFPGVLDLLNSAFSIYLD